MRSTKYNAMENSILIQNLTIDGLRSIITEVLSGHQAAPEPIQAEKYLTRHQVADLLKISLVTLNTATNRGDLKGYKIGNRVLYDRVEVLTAIENMRRYRKGRRD